MEASKVLKNQDKFKANVEALDIKLTQEEIAWLDLQSDKK
jgi:aryl-alcohol dehydrogenase-like predicted oxidoreductase